MATRLLLGTCFAAIAIGLSAPAIVSTRAPITASDARQVMQRESLAAPGGELPPEAEAKAEPAGDAGYLGVVVALQSVELSAKSDGTLERLEVHVGDHVKGGMPIARLDTRSVVRDLAMAEASLRVAEADHDRLVIELREAADRQARLNLIPELVPREQLATAASQEQVAAARLRGGAAELAARRARTEQLSELLRDARIVAPFDGTIAARYVDAGTTLSRGAPIVRLISPTSLVVRFAVPEDEAAGVAAGRPVIVRVASAGLTAEAVIATVSPEIDAALRMIVVEARLAGNAGHPATIPSGAIARVLFPTDENREVHALAIN